MNEKSTVLQKLEVSIWNVFEAFDEVTSEYGFILTGLQIKHNGNPIRTSQFQNISINCKIKDKKELFESSNEIEIHTILESYRGWLKSERRKQLRGI